MVRQPAERERFFVGFPGELIVRHALKNLPRVRHFVIEFEKQCLADCHSGLSGRIAYSTGGPARKAEIVTPLSQCRLFDAWRENCLLPLLLLQRVDGHQRADGMRPHRGERIGVLPRFVAVDVPEKERFLERCRVFGAQTIFGGYGRHAEEGSRA
jgi:hypothetical protein